MIGGRKFLKTKIGSFVFKPFPIVHIHYRYGGNEGEDRSRMDRESDSASTWRSDPSTFKAREAESERRTEARPAPNDNSAWRRPREEGAERPRPSDARAEEARRGKC